MSNVAPALEIVPFQARTNMFQISGFPKQPYTQYQDIVPAVQSSRRAYEIIDELQHREPSRFTPRAVYDGKAIMFSSKNDLGGAYSIDMSRGARRKVFEVSINRVGTLDPQKFRDALRASDTNLQLSGEHQDTISLLQLIVKQATIRRHGISPKAKFFLRSDTKPNDITRGLNVAVGFWQSVRPLCGKLFVNIDTVHMPVYKEGDLLNVAISFLGERFGVRDLAFKNSSDPKFRELQNFFKGVRIRYKKEVWQRIRPGTSPPPYKRILRLVPQAGSETFMWGDRKCSVKQYYKDKYNLDINRPLVFGVKIGSTAVLPAEICEIEKGQVYRRSLMTEQQEQMIGKSRKDPSEKLKMIKDAVAGDEQQFDYAASDIMQASGMSVNPNPVDVQGWSFKSPCIEYGNKKTAQINKGGWNLNGQQFFKPTVLRKEQWMVINFSSDVDTGPDLEKKNRLIGFLQKLQENLVRLGILVASAQSGQILTGNRQAPKTSLEKLKSYPKPSFLLVILPKYALEIYHAVKHWGNMEVEIPTQCAREDKFKINDRSLDQYCNNLALQINTKIGGINSKTNAKIIYDCICQNGIVIGCDVSHPPPGNLTKPSIASLVSSYDREALKYASFIRVQEPSTEIISDIDQMLENAIDKYANSGSTPGLARALERVIIFRDGVSDGELQKVKQEEILKIKEFLQRCKYRAMDRTAPKLVYIVVTKRHHVRFFPKYPLKGNCPPGFVVDTGIVYDTPMDFYLQSHAGLIGTSRPSHYIVLENECGLTTRQIQELSFALSHNYAGATRSVSLPAPLYYADRLCSYAEYNLNPAAKIPGSDAASSAASREQERACDMTFWGQLNQNPKLSDKLYYL
ncbi:hypothetical protein NLI96_g159 [Meripilus lineatus]|uniref:Piwi-domain-containing protein n=1 Tax=Meripilus lineatus TaxID=2056292 RepID=A0AAD5VCZ3_9APHY|nr:hypothetical protein NLI96_g159 [Physisporinus lineatus]